MFSFNAVVLFACLQELPAVAGNHCAQNGESVVKFCQNNTAVSIDIVVDPDGRNLTDGEECKCALTTIDTHSLSVFVSRIGWRHRGELFVIDKTLIYPEFRESMKVSNGTQILYIHGSGGGVGSCLKIHSHESDINIQCFELKNTKTTTRTTTRTTTATQSPAIASTSITYSPSPHPTAMPSSPVIVSTTTLHTEKSTSAFVPAGTGAIENSSINLGYVAGVAGVALVAGIAIALMIVYVRTRRRLNKNMTVASDRASNDHSGGNALQDMNNDNYIHPIDGNNMYDKTEYATVGVDYINSEAAEANTSSEYAYCSNEDIPVPGEYENPYTGLSKTGTQADAQEYSSLTFG